MGGRLSRYAARLARRSFEHAAAETVYRMDTLKRSLRRQLEADLPMTVRSVRIDADVLACATPVTASAVDAAANLRLTNRP